MAHWTDKENWINKKPPEELDPIGPTDVCGNQISWEEFNTLEVRARQLKRSELDELVWNVGIIMRGPGQKLLLKDEYIEMLDEADDFQKIYDYLERHGV